MLVGGVYKITSLRDERVFVVRIEGIREDDDWVFLDRAYYGVILFPRSYANHSITILDDMWNYEYVSRLELALL